MTPPKNSRQLLGLALILSPVCADAAIIGPYIVDANTVHLWHLDEASTASSAANAVLLQNSLIAVDGDPIGNPENPITGLLGVAGASGFGNAANISATDLGLGYDGNNNGVFNPDLTSTNFGADAISTTTIMGANGSFTLEALVSLAAITGSNRQIISMENTGTNAQRPFQFSVTTDGTLRYRGFGTGTLNGVGSTNISFEAAIPITGDDAFAANTWFHAAFTYDGEGTGSLYWTLLDPSRTEANLLASVTGLSDLPSNSAPLVIGNENRNTFAEGLQGSIDEVRISNVARGADQFLFVIPEPSSALLGALGTLALLRRRREAR